MSAPNIILLTIDTLRTDRLGCYGCPRPLTPNLDRLAESGVRFTKAITGGSWTQAAFPVILTSSYASMYGGCLGALAPERPSPIEALSACGYTTGGFSTSPLLSRNYGYHRGFRHFTDLLPGERDPFLRRLKGGQRLLRQTLTHRVARLLGIRTRPARLYVSAAQLTDALCNWLDGVTAPFFVWAHYMDVHWPYHREETLTHPADIAQAWRDVSHLHAANWNGVPITPAQRDHYIRLYEEAVQYTDAQIGRLLDYLQQSGRAENTVILAVADHGEEFLEHGRWGHWENNLHDEILNVPLLIHLPRHGQAQTVTRLVRTLDIMPTILHLADCPPPTGIEGKSLLPLWQGDEEAYPVTEAISEMWRDEWHIIALRTETFKFIWDSRRPDQPALFDLRADPTEQHNISHQHPERVQHFRALVEAHRRRAAETRPSRAITEPELDDELTARLRDLGYLE